MTPHAPQCWESESRSTQLPQQSVNPSSQLGMLFSGGGSSLITSDAQVAAVQTKLSQTTPHAPQLVGSEERSVHVSEHRTCPAAQTASGTSEASEFSAIPVVSMACATVHSPSTQDADSHTPPQIPQFNGLRDRYCDIVSLTALNYVRPILRRSETLERWRHSCTGWLDGSSWW
jgi:hypothetical protein